VCSSFSTTASPFMRAQLELYLLEAHSINGIIAFPKAIPSSVSEYSTLGGITANAFLLIRPAFSSSFSLLVRVFGFMSPSLSWSSLNLSVSQLPTVHTIWSAHFLLITSIIPSNGQIHSGKELQLSSVIVDHRFHSYYRIRNRQYK